MPVSGDDNTPSHGQPDDHNLEAQSADGPGRAQAPAAAYGLDEDDLELWGAISEQLDADTMAVETQETTYPSTIH